MEEQKKALAMPKPVQPVQAAQAPAQTLQAPVQAAAVQSTAGYPTVQPAPAMVPGHSNVTVTVHTPLITV